MKKSVYSVLLSDDLVSRIDAAAYKKGISRSAMIDRVLAEYLEEETIEMKMNNVFDNMERMIAGYSGLRFLSQASDYMASVQSALAYRYNPTVKYSIELFPEGALGQLKITLRTKNDSLLRIMEKFYSFFIGLEKKYIGERAYAYDGFRFVRVFVRPEGMDAETAGRAIAAYVADFDKYLRIYFADLDNEPAARLEVEKEYAADVSVKEVIL